MFSSFAHALAWARWAGLGGKYLGLERAVVVTFCGGHRRRRRLLFCLFFLRRLRVLRRLVRVPRLWPKEELSEHGNSCTPHHLSNLLQCECATSHPQPRQQDRGRLRGHRRVDASNLLNGHDWCPLVPVPVVELRHRHQAAELRLPVPGITVAERAVSSERMRGHRREDPRATAHQRSGREDGASRHSRVMMASSRQCWIVLRPNQTILCNMHIHSPLLALGPIFMAPAVLKQGLFC